METTGPTPGAVLTTMLPDLASFFTTDLIDDVNLTVVTIDENREIFNEPLSVKITWGALYFILSLVALGGNCIVCYIILSSARMRNVTNYFIANMAISDAMMAVICVNPAYWGPVLRYWPFGEFLCRVGFFVQSVSVGVSVLSIAAICVDRYVAIIYPLRPRMTHRVALLCTGAMWALSSAVALPTLLNAKYVKYDSDDGGVFHDCVEEWTYKFYYSIALMIWQYFVPLFVLSVGYGRIIWTLWYQRIPGEREEMRDAKQAASKRKLIKMLSVVLLTFALTWLPMQVFTLSVHANKLLLKYKHINHIYFASHITAMASTACNPIVYYYMNGRFRNGFRRVFAKCLPCCSIPAPDEMSLGRTNTNVTRIDSTCYQMVTPGNGKRTQARSPTAGSPTNYRKVNGVSQI